MIERHKGLLVRQLAADLGPRYAPDRASLENFRVSHQAQKAALERCRNMENRLDSLTASGSGIVWIGSVGTGKDHLAAALMYAAAGRFGISCRWVNGRDVFGQSRDGIAQGRREEELLRSLTSPAILCLSDPLPIQGAMSPWNIDLLYRVMDRRYHRLLPTWMTLNVLDLADASTRLTPPIVDRLCDRCEVIECRWPSHRQQRP